MGEFTVAKKASILDGLASLSALVSSTATVSAAPAPAPTPTPAPPPPAPVPPPPPPAPAPAPVFNTNRARYDALWAAQIASDSGQALYASLTGSDSNPGTQAAPFRTIEKLKASLSATKREGIVGPGVWSVGNSGAFNDVMGAAIVGGQPGRPIVIRAADPFRTVIEQPSALYDGGMVVLTRSPYVHLDGFVFDKKSAGAEDAVYLDSPGNRMSRYVVINRTGSTYSGGIGVHRDCEAVDGFVFGCGRYAVHAGTYQAAGRAGGEKTSIRRTVILMGFNNLEQPAASIVFYGSDSNKATGFQAANCFEIASPGMNRTSNGTKWAFIYGAHGITGMLIQGCGAAGGGATYGVYTFDNGNPNAGIVEDCFAAGYSVPSMVHQNSGSSIARNCTITGSLAFGGTVTKSGILVAQNVPPTVRVNGQGAEQRYAIGGLCKFYGEDGFDRTSDLPLWPLPYEDEFKRILLENPLPKPSGWYGSAIGNPLGEKSISQYLYESAGAVMPAGAFA